MAGIWPTTLPQAPELSSFDDRYPNRLITSEMDTGDTKVRRRGKKGWTASATYYLTSAQLDILQAFFEDTIKDGALCFDWPHPRLGRPVRARITGGQDGMYNAPPVGPDKYKVALSILYWPDAPTTS